ncbi:MAG: LPS export ABC transporter periplasmic protein LptC [Treponema sp.]|nr:LPS export ABC transporter periplasmic protein LptC [Treponema sp.]
MERSEKKLNRPRCIPLSLAALLFMAHGSCSFNYDNQTPDKDEPNLILDEVEYVRVQDGNPSIKLAAREVRRYEDKQLMEIDTLSFTQFDRAPAFSEKLPEVNAQGRAGAARVEMDTMNLSMNGGVEIEVISEDMKIVTAEVSWQDAERRLDAPGKIGITKSDGTALTGAGFSADIRRKTFEFASDVEGVTIDEDNDGQNSASVPVQEAP